MALGRLGRCGVRRELKPASILLVGPDEHWTLRLQEWSRLLGESDAPHIHACHPKELVETLSRVRPDALVWDAQAADPTQPENWWEHADLDLAILFLVASSDHPAAVPWIRSESVRRESLDGSTFACVLRSLLRARRAETSPLQVDSSFRTAFYQSPISMAITLTNGTFLWVNAALADMLGYQPEELQGKNDCDIIHPAERPAYRALLESASPGQIPWLRSEKRLLHRGGGTIWIELNAGLVPGTEEYPPYFISQFLDIRPRREAEDTLRRSEQWFRALVEHSSDAVVLLGDNGRIRYASPSVQSILGHTPSELIGTEGATFVHPSDLQENRLFFLKVLRARGVSFATFRVLHRQGGWRWLEGVATNQLNDPSVNGIVFNLRDITERKRATETLQQQARIVANLSDAILVTDTSRRIVDCNPAAVRMFGYDRTELIGHSPAKLHSSEETEQIDRAIRVGLGQGGTWSSEMGFLRKDGSGGICEMTIAPLHDRQGEFVGAIEINHDISERKQAEANLENSERRYLELFTNANDVIFSADFSGNLMEVNPKAEIVFGKSREELIRFNLMQLLTEESRRGMSKMLEQLKQGDEAPTLEVEILNAGRERTTLEVNGQLLLESGKRVGIQAIARDVTERKGLESQLRQGQKMEALGRLAGGVAHDFNNLLTVIGGYSEYLMEELGSEDPLQESAREITRAVARASGLTRHMLAFSRQQLLRPVVLQLNQSLESVASLLRRVIGEDIELIVRTDPDLYPIRADLNQIEQVLLNLAVNARDAMPAGGKLVLRSRNISLREPRMLVDSSIPAGDYIALSVQDNGIGMDSELKGRIFEPFFTTKGERGTGLGLSTVHGIVCQSQGYIQVDSAPGQGTTFTIYFQRADSQVTQMSPLERKLVSGDGNETILVVEDQEEVRCLIRHVLENRGYTVLSAACGADALELCQNRKDRIHLLLTDVKMPGIAVSMLAREVLSIYPDVTILYMSGYAPDKSLVDQEDMSRRFLSKPFRPDELLHRVRMLLDRTA